MIILGVLIIVILLYFRGAPGKTDKDGFSALSSIGSFFSNMVGSMKDVGRRLKSVARKAGGAVGGVARNVKTAGSNIGSGIKHGNFKQIGSGVVGLATNITPVGMLAKAVYDNGGLAIAKGIVKGDLNAIKQGAIDVATKSTPMGGMVKNVYAGGLGMAQGVLKGDITAIGKGALAVATNVTPTGMIAKEVYNNMGGKNLMEKTGVTDVLRKANAVADIAYKQVDKAAGISKTANNVVDAGKNVGVGIYKGDINQIAKGTYGLATNISPTGRLIGKAIDAGALNIATSLVKGDFEGVGKSALNVATHTTAIGKVARIAYNHGGKDVLSSAGNAIANKVVNTQQPQNAAQSPVDNQNINTGIEQQPTAYEPTINQESGVAENQGVINENQNQEYGVENQNQESGVVENQNSENQRAVVENQNPTNQAAKAPTDNQNINTGEESSIFSFW